MKNDIQYMLAIKIDKNSYRPLEWEQLSSYNSENLTTLEGIDKFTSKTNENDLVKEIINENLLELTDLIQNFTIIYKEKGKIRELKEGVIFKESKECIKEENIIILLKENYKNKNLINHLTNILNKNKETKEIKEFIVILKNIDYFANRSQNAILAALDKYKELPYKIKRILGINVLKFINK